LHILLVRLRQIGDVVFTTPALGALRRHFTDAHLVYLVEPEAAAVVAGHPDLDDVIVAPRVRGTAGFLADVRLGRRLRQARFDLAIDFHGGPRASLLTWLSGAPIRVGYDVAGRSWMYTKVVHRPRVLRPRHSVENQWDLLGALGIAPPTPRDNPMTMAVDADAARRVDTMLADAGVGADEDVVVLHVSAGSPFRRWPLPSFVEVVSRLAALGNRVVVTSGPSEQAAAAEVIDAARARLPGERQELVLKSAEIGLAELRALFERAALFIGGDSGPLHIAATSRVPIVGLYGPTLPVRSAPWRSGDAPTESVEVTGLECRPCDQRVCAPGDFRCLTWLRPEQVVEAAERALAAATR
jgi:ADP-heptose:LPS heptosyltransferase